MSLRRATGRMVLSAYVRGCAGALVLLFGCVNATIHGMLGLILFAVAIRQAPIVLPEFSAWDGTNLASLKVGLSEPQLGKLARKSKTVGPDPASVRVAVDRKGCILTAILTGTNNKGHVSGFVVEMEKDQPIESFDALQTELGKPDFQAYPPIRYSDWSLAVWSQKGIAAVIQNGSRPLVQRVLLSPPAPLAKNLDLWDRTPTPLAVLPQVPVAGFDITVRTDPRKPDFEEEIERSIRRRARRFIESGGSTSWVPAFAGGPKISVSERITFDRNLTIDGSVSITVTIPTLGTQSFTESTLETFNEDRDFRDRAEANFYNMMTKLDRAFAVKIGRLSWQAEWRQFTGLPRVR